MNIFQRIFNLFRPQARYEAAQTSTYKSWLPGGLVDARIDISKATREEIMRKARYFEKNSIARRLASVHCDFTVGPNGMVFTPASSDPNWNERAKTYLDKTLSVIDLNTRQTFGSIQQMAAWRDFFDGDFFIVKTRGQDNQGRWWPRIQLFEAHLCKTPDARKADEGKTIVDGVEIDANGRPTGFWFLTSSDADKFQLIDAKNVIHVYDPERANQKRGLSKLAAAINYLHRLDDLQELEFRACQDSAEKSTFIKTATGQLPAGLGGVAGKFRDTTVKSTVAPASDENRLREAVGGRLVALGLNEDVEQFQPTRPTEATRWLWSYLTSCACSVTGTPKLIAFSEWLDGAQGTVVRGDYNIASQNYKAQSAVYAAAFREVIIYVLSWGIATEKTLADPPADWTNIAHTAPRDINVDIGRNSTARINELEVGLTSHEAEYESLGLNARAEVTRQIKFIAFVKKKCAEISAAEGVEVKPAEILGSLITNAEPKPDPSSMSPDPTEEPDLVPHTSA